MTGQQLRTIKEAEERKEAFMNEILSQLRQAPQRADALATGLGAESKSKMLATLQRENRIFYRSGKWNFNQ